MQHQRTVYLLDQYVSGKISEAELSEFRQLVEAGPAEKNVPEAIREWLEARGTDGATAAPFDAQRWQQVLNTILSADRQLLKNKVPAIVPMYRRAWVRYAAAVLIVLGMATWWWNTKNKSASPEQVATTDTTKSNVAPGRDGAILTLADGTAVVLDSLGNGVVASQSGAKVVLENGRLVYNASGKRGEAIVYNTMTTPNGRQFNVLLPDGTKVWLNAASSLRYPTVFSGKERRVEVTGEAYFEVAPLRSFDKFRTGPSTSLRVPFIVATKNMTVEVLGTHFNINAYDDEPSINTTLLEGSVQVKNDHGSALLKPGEQARVYDPGHSRGDNEDKSGIHVLSQVDTKQVIAWKNGAFVFNDADLPAVMRQLARWYNVEVEYTGAIPKGVFSGKIGRGLSLAEVLEGLSETRVKFRIEGGNKIVVLP